MLNVDNIVDTADFFLNSRVNKYLWHLKALAYTYSLPLDARNRRLAL
jgi:hypothetical protein